MTFTTQHKETCINEGRVTESLANNYNVTWPCL